MDIILLVLHVVLALGIISLVLLQKGAGANAGAVLGGGAGSVFGASGSSNFLSKTTAILATAFFINSMVLAYMASHREGPATVIDQIEQFQQVDETAPQSTIQPLDQTTDETVPLPFDEPVETDVPLPANEETTQSDVPPPAGETK
ncbi:MAG: preprotein translocase subunit SecG [Gammaproteobacteria bacterium]|nr:preprotein translocase subunit SecG [Gammaproteobacteria bacterium]